MSVEPPSIAALLRHDGEGFVRVAYECLLRRPPGADEIRPWLARLADGSLTKRDVLAAIQASPEGRAQAVALPGLASARVAMRLRRAPLVGYAVRWLEQLARLPRNAQRTNACETAIAMLRDEQAALASALRELATTAQSSREAAVRSRDDVAALSSTVDTLDAMLRKAELLPPAGGEREARDAWYRRFEERFRGSRDEILARLAFYLPILSAQAASATSGARFADVGCGRGELLELAARHGLAMYGIDASDAMVAQCRAQGLEAAVGDAVEHLEGLPEGSLAGITAIHVIEHLPFPALARLVAAAFRALRPGGVVILETPNPENLIVGACNFYYDPTHVRPLPPEPVRFLLESNGFERVAIERLHPGAQPDDVERATDPVGKLYASIMLVPQDYAVIGYKPAEALA